MGNASWCEQVNVLVCIPMKIAECSAYLCLHITMKDFFTVDIGERQQQLDQPLPSLLFVDGLTAFTEKKTWRTGTIHALLHETV